MKAGSLHLKRKGEGEESSGKKERASEIERIEDRDDCGGDIGRRVLYSRFHLVYDFVCTYAVRGSYPVLAINDRTVDLWEELEIFIDRPNAAPFSVRSFIANAG